MLATNFGFSKKIPEHIYENYMYMQSLLIIGNRLFWSSSVLNFMLITQSPEIRVNKKKDVWDIRVTINASNEFVL